MITIIYIFLISLFLPSFLGDIIDIHHYEKPSEDGTSIRNQETHKILIITVLYKEGILIDRNQFRKALPEMVKTDQCHLMSSAINQLDVIIKLSCHKKMDNLIETDDIPEIKLTESYLKSLGHIEKMAIVVNKAFYKPSFWYGTSNYNQLEGAYEQYKEKRKNPNKMPMYTNFIEYPAPWGLDRIDMHYGFLDNEYNYNYTGEYVDIYVIDTGIRTTHREFEGRATFMINTVGDGQDTDCVGHGTHVASIVGSRTYGVAKKAQIFAVKVLDCTGAGDIFSIITGIMAVKEHHKSRTGRAAIASLSLGGDRSHTLDQSILTLTASDIITVVAAGNENDDACKYSPSVLSATSHIITVGASTNRDEKPRWSNYGACVSISAPGEQIIGAYYTSDEATTVLSGTSMATPFVSGVAALILHQNPLLSPLEVKLLILNWATPNTVSRTTELGGGKNLLYSLIQINQSPDIVTLPSPSPPELLIIPPTTPPIYRNKASTMSGISLFSILCLFFIFLLIN